MAASRIGTTVDGYRIVDVIGRGGMGTVYKAVDEALDKTVALKMMAPRLAEDTTFLARFKAEAKALARLDAPGIVRVLALRETEDGLFIVMEHVDGPTLDTILRRHAPLDAAEALPLIRQMLEAIAHAHDSDVLHRDLKPSNILLTDDGLVKMTDFGLAKIQASGTDLTSTHETAGTLHYMSPEQIRGLRNVDARSDLFALGLILYEMLAGRLPFDRTGSNYTIQRAIVEEPFPPLATVADDVPHALAAVVDRLLAKNPDDRFPDAHAALEALEPVDAQLTAPAGPRSWKPAEDADSSGWSGGLIAAFALAGVLLLGGAYVTIQWLLQPPMPSSEQATRAGRPADPPSARPSLSITTTPNGAAVYVDGDSLGTTPLDTTRPAAAAALRLVLADYQPFDTTLAAADSAQTLAVALTPTRPARDASSPSTDAEPAADDAPPVEDEPVATSPRPPPSDTASDPEPSPSAVSESTEPAPPPTTGTLVVTSSPSGATVRVDGTARGTTPLTLPALDTGAYTVQVETDAHRPVRTTASVAAGDTLRLAPTLAPIPASIRVRAVPYGSIAIDGTTRLNDSDVALTDSLAPGTYRLQATYRDLTWTRTVTLAPGADYRRVIDFTRTIAVGVTAQTASGERVPNAEVLVDGTSRGYLPLQLTLRVGDHTVTVRKEGFAPAERTITVDETLEGPLVFELAPHS
jgi:serine/threonine protein kinase